MGINYGGRKESKSGVKSKFIIAFIAFVLIVGIKVMSSKSTPDRAVERVELGY